METFLGFDAVVLARFQDALSTGLARCVTMINGLWLTTKEEVHLNLFRFWARIFAISFAMGVFSGTAMSYEVQTAPSVGAGFRGIMLFGRDHVGPRLYTMACVVVAVGTEISAMWISSATFWAQPLRGFSIAKNGRRIPELMAGDLYPLLAPYGLAHTPSAAYLAMALIPVILD